MQLRTLAQHLWAAASHDLQYKSGASVPAGVARAVHRAAALLELVDIELERVLEQRQDYRESIAKLGSDDPLLDLWAFSSEDLEGSPATLRFHPEHPDLNVVLFPEDHVHVVVALRAVQIIDSLRERQRS